MSEHLCLAPLLESYFRRRLAKQRNATPATITSYRDALRMLILFAAARLGKEPAAVKLEELDRDLVLAFLDELEEKRNNSVATRNARLAAVRSFFHHVAAADPAPFGIAQRVLAIPTKRAHIEVTHHLTNAEVDAIVAAPDRTTARGRRDRALLLFLARTGARVSEAIGVNASDLHLQRGRLQVLLHGKGCRDRVVPIPRDLGAITDGTVERARARSSRAAAAFRRDTRRAPDALRSDARRAASCGPGQVGCTEPERQADITAHLPAFSRHEAPPVGRGSPDDPGLARPRPVRHNPPPRTSR